MAYTWFSERCLLMTDFSGFTQFCSMFFQNFFFVLGILSRFFFYCCIIYGISSHFCKLYGCMSLFFSIDCNHVFLYILYIPLVIFNVMCLKKYTFQWKEFSDVSHLSLGINEENLTSLSLHPPIRYLYISMRFHWATSSLG